ncbi:hypothetical protein D3C84_864590 [compost metagenome]
MTAVRESGAYTDDAHGQIHIGRIDPNLFIRPHRHERDNAVYIDEMAAKREPRCHSDRVLLGDARVDESSRETISEWFPDGEAEIRRYNDQPLVMLGALQHFPDERVSHPLPSLPPSCLIASLHCAVFGDL